MLFAPEFPRRLTLELTNTCNYRCRMCPSLIKPNQHKGMMDSILFQRIVDEAAEYLPVTLVPFFRGESLLHPNLISLLRYARRKGVGPIQLASNASLLNGKMANALLETGIDFISFSLDTHRPEEYARIRPGGDLKSVENNILQFMALRDRFGYQTQIQVSATRTALNQGNLQEFINFWKSKADTIRIYYEHSADGHTGSLNCSEVPREMERRPCEKVFTDMVLYYDGQVALCNHDWYRQNTFPDLRKSSIREIWQGEAYRELRHHHLNPHELKDETCLHCDHWKIYYLDKPFIGELYERSPKGKHILYK